MYRGLTHCLQAGVLVCWCVGVLVCWCVGVRLKSHDPCMCVCCESQMMRAPHMCSHRHIKAGWCVSVSVVVCCSESDMETHAHMQSPSHKSRLVC